MGAGGTLTASDPEPPPGTLVRDDCGTVWVNDGHRPCCWVQPEAEVHDPESWMKVAGNYGPVTVLEWGDGDTVAADTPIPDFMYPPEKCPHCDARPTANRADEHITAEHGDLPPCTARYFDGGHALYLCAFRAGHADGQYGDWHASVSGALGRFVWNDTLAGAQPHREEAQPRLGGAHP